jgi:hypothetical protein
MTLLATQMKAGDSVEVEAEKVNGLRSAINGRGHQTSTRPVKGKGTVRVWMGGKLPGKATSQTAPSA